MAIERIEMLIDLSPLYKYRDFRLLYLSQLIAGLGAMLTYVALPYQIYHLTHSSLAVGNVGIIELVPLLITSLWGGALADKLDKRKLLLFAEFALFIISILLLLNTIFEPRLWVIYVLAGLSSAFNGFHRPTLEAITQNLVKHEDMPAVSALSTFRWSVAMIAGPSAAGLLLASYGLTTVYLLDVLTYTVSLTAIFAMRCRIPAKQSADPIFRSIKEGIRYAFSRQELIGTYTIDFAAMVFGMPMALFPAIALTFHSTTAIGWLYAAPSIGMFAASIFSGWVNKIKRHGIAIAISASIWGLAIIAFGCSHYLIVAIFFLSIAGAADAVSGLFRVTMWNQTIPKELRGRLAGIEMISYMSGPLLGNTEAGLVAAAFGTTFSVISGGILCVLTVAILVLLLPKYRRYTAQ